MPPRLASCLCAALILWLFYRNSRGRGGVSAGLWIPFLWLGINASKPLAYWFGAVDSSADLEALLEGSAIDRNVFLGLILAGVTVLIRRRLDWNLILRSNRCIWLLHFYLLVSVIWSDYPFVSFKRWFKDFGNVIMILIIITEKNPVGAVRWVFSVCTCALVPLSVLFVKYYPDIGRYYDRWIGTAYYGGVTTNKNSLGVLAMVSGLIVLWELAKTWKRPASTGRTISLLTDATVLLMCVWLLKSSRSATSLVCFGIGAAVFVASHSGWVKGNLRRLSWYVGGFALFGLLFVAVPDLRKLVVGMLGRDMTLTDRTVIWEAALNAKTNPLIGTGFRSFWLRSDAIQLSEYGVLTEAHNGYLETYLNTGLIGLFLLFAVLISACKNAVRQLSMETALGHLYLALFLSGVVYNYTEATFNVENVIGFYLWLIAMRYWRPAVAGRGSEAMKPSRSNSPKPSSGDVRAEVGAMSRRGLFPRLRNAGHVAKVCSLGVWWSRKADT